MKKLFSPVEVTEILRRETNNKITKWEVYAYIRTGILDAEKVGRTFSVSEKSVKKLIATIQKANHANQKN